MELYEVEATRWYYSVVFYRVIADSYDDAYARVGREAVGVMEVRASSPTWNGEEEYHNVELLKTAHDMNAEDNAHYDHTNCQYLGTNMWDCGHIDLQDVGEAEWVQLPLIEGHEASPDNPKSWIMWFEKWADALDGDAYAEAWEQYQASQASVGKW